MATTPTKAVLIDIRSCLADRNLRRSTSAFSLNYPAVDDDVSQNSFTVNPDEQKTIITPMAVNSITLLRTSQPLDVNIVPRGSDGGSINFRVIKAFLLDFDIESFTLTVPDGGSAAKVSLIQG